ncbi:MAG TPA: HEAT repeat domain-containing protein [Vicinamibacterales bacterium]
MWRLLALLTILLAGAAAALWYYHGSAELVRRVPIIRNEDRWLDDLLSRSPKDVETASAELQQRGAAAIPIIQRTLQDNSANPARRKAALKAAALLGVRAIDVLPDVAALLAQPEYAPEAGLALSFMGSAAVGPLRDALTSDQTIVRREALRSLGKLRERASLDPQLVMPALLNALADPEPSVREVAVTYLGIVRDDPAREVPGLIQTLEDAEPSVRRAAAGALGAYGAAAESAIPALKKAAADKDEDVQREAGRALVQISEAREK